MGLPGLLRSGPSQLHSPPVPLGGTSEQEWAFIQQPPSLEGPLGAACCLSPLQWVAHVLPLFMKNDDRPLYQPRERAMNP